MKILILYGTTEGQTRKIAGFLAKHLTDHLHEPLLVEAGEVPANLDLHGFGAILVAASLHLGRFQPSVVHFVKQHVALIDAKPNAFIAVSLAVLSDDPEDAQGLDHCVETFMHETNWSPGRIHHEAGAFLYTTYDFFKRWAMKYIAYRRGAPSDTSRDYEFTDWTGLAEFADDFAAAAARPALESGT